MRSPLAIALLSLSVPPMLNSGAVGARTDGGVAGSEVAAVVGGEGGLGGDPAGSAGEGASSPRSTGGGEGGATIARVVSGCGTDVGGSRSGVSVVAAAGSPCAEGAAVV